VRTLPLLDWALEEVTERGLEETQRELRQILRVGAYQILFLERIPVYAAVHQCVEAAKLVSAGAAGFVNGILRTVAERREEFLEIPYRFSGSEAAALRHGMPEWLASRYVERFGPEEGEALLAALQEEGRSALIFPTPAAASQALPLLSREGYKLHPDPLLPRTAWIEEGDPSESEAFRRGLFYLMDPASQAPAQLMPLKEERRVLDLCSAPGGKTVVFATRLGARGWVLSADRSAGRLAMVRENLDRLGLRNVRLARVDVGAGLPFGPVWPAVLLDAPCSSLGTLRRNPEIRWQIRETALRGLAARQAAYLKEAARVVAPGGVLGYSVCSIEPEETQEVVNGFLADHAEFRECSLRLASPWKELVSPAGEGRFYLLPTRHPWDGFYMAFLRRRP
jgi:16S rRNA (cytosine967-C5)-methyltransferase